MKLVVGLGNPGRKYIGTRHNIGFEVIAELARRHAAGLRPKAKFDGELVETFYTNEKLCLLFPLTFMNLSGNCVKQVVDFYKIPLDDFLVVCDDINLPVARIRFRPHGSAGGQNGLDSIISRLGTKDFNRLRIGIGRPPEGWETSGYVLGKFDAQVHPEIEKAVKRAADGVETWLTDGIDTAMNRFNVSANPKTKKLKTQSNDEKPEQKGLKSETKPAKPTESNDSE